MWWRVSVVDLLKDVLLNSLALEKAFPEPCNTWIVCPSENLGGGVSLFEPNQIPKYR